VLQLDVLVHGAFRAVRFATAGDRASEVPLDFSGRTPMSLALVVVKTASLMVVVVVVASSARDAARGDF